MTWMTRAFLVAALIIGLVALAKADAASAQEGGGTTHVVQSGDTCWDLAASFMGGGYLYPSILEANPGIQQTPSNKCLFYPGDLVAIPPVSAAGTIPTTGNVIPGSPSIPPGLGPASDSTTTIVEQSGWSIREIVLLSLLVFFFALFVAGLVAAAFRLFYAPNTTMTYVNEVRGEQSTTHTEVERHEGGFTDRIEYHFHFHDDAEAEDDEDETEHAPATASTNGSSEQQPAGTRFGSDPEH